MAAQGPRERRLTRTQARWAIAFLIGLATVTAAGFSWRAAQIGSTAAFDDRQSISQTVGVEQGAVQRIVTVAGEVREYARYRSDYAVAAALDRQAERLAQAGGDRLAAVARNQADALREGATRRAAAAGVFGSFTIASQLLRPSDTPRPFDAAARAKALEAEQTTSLEGPGTLDPDRWAADAVAIRVRVNGLIRWAFVVLLSVLLYTIAEVSTRMRTMLALAAAGLVVYTVGLVGGLTTVFFA